MTNQSNLNTNPTSTLPPEATWAELAERTDLIDSQGLDGWIESSLAEVEEFLSDFVTPRSLKASLREGR